MKQTEIHLLMKYIDKSNEDVRRTVGVAFAHTDGRIEELNKTIKEHNGRLKIVEDCQEKDGKVIKVLRWTYKHWYLLLGGLAFLILIMIPIVEWLGLKGLIALIK